MRPFLLVNAGSGGGRLQEGIVAAALEMGVEHHVVGPGDDFTDVLAGALARGADVLAAAGGDGTLCTVADAAMAHDLPMIAVPAGTRNHFALDLGLDLDDPAGTLRSCLTSGYERRVDVGSVNGSTFLNNASLGLYAAAVGSTGYREHKATAFARAAHEALSPEAGGQANLTLALPGSSLIGLAEGTASLLIANNAYAPTFAPGARLRPRLDAGEVWTYFGGGLAPDRSALSSLVHAVGAILEQRVLRGAFGAARVEISADRPDVPIAVDGERRRDLTAPFTFVSRPGALRLRVPQDASSTTVGIHLSW